MTRMLMIVLALALALAVPASAQEEEDPTPTPAPELIAPDEDPEPAPEETGARGCERGEGTDADYAYCPDDVCDEQSDDADYTYTCVAANGGAPEPAPPAPRPASAVRPLAAQTLPVTGGEPAIIGAAGIAFLLAGAGLRLRARTV